MWKKAATYRCINPIGFIRSSFINSPPERNPAGCFTIGALDVNHFVLTEFSKKSGSG